MRSRRQQNAQPVSRVLSKACHARAVVLLAVLLLVFRPGSAKAQSGSASPTPSQPQSQKASQPEAESVASGQKDSANKPQTAPASAKADAKKSTPKAKHVYTNEDLSGIGGTISVVGSGSSEGASAANDNSKVRPRSNPGSSGDKDEAYWRGKAHTIRDQIAAVDQQIDKVKQEIAKSGPAAFDPTTRLQQNVIIVHDRNAELQQLQDRKQNLEKQLDELTDEGRKAGADSGWFR